MTEDAKPLMLLVDDDEDSRFLYVHYLTSPKGGFRVSEAADGRDGVDQTIAQLPDVVVMDLTLPVMDGWAALAAIRANETTRNTLVVALTGHSIGKGESKDGASFDGVLTKPCLPEDVAKKCHSLLAARKATA